MKSEFNIAPSFFVRNSCIYKQWCSISQCRECNLTSKYEDMHPVNPCPSCGSKAIRKRVGKWIVTKKSILFGIIRKEQGYWEIKE